jgi:hypothetical protein
MCNGDALVGGTQTVLPARSEGQYLYTDLAKMFFTGNGPLKIKKENGEIK